MEHEALLCLYRDLGCLPLDALVTPHAGALEVHGLVDEDKVKGAANLCLADLDLLTDGDGGVEDVVGRGSWRQGSLAALLSM